MERNIWEDINYKPKVRFLTWKWQLGKISKTNRRDWDLWYFNGCILLSGVGAFNEEDWTPNCICTETSLTSYLPSSHSRSLYLLSLSPPSSFSISLATPLSLFLFLPIPLDLSILSLSLSLTHTHTISISLKHGNTHMGYPILFNFKRDHAKERK